MIGLKLPFFSDDDDGAFTEQYAHNNLKINYIK